MSVFRSVRRLTGALTLLFVMGVVTGFLLADFSGWRLASAAAAIFVAALVSWAFLRSWRDSLAALQPANAHHHEDGERSTSPERPFGRHAFTESRPVLASAPWSEHEQRNLIAGSPGNSLLLESVLGTMVEAVAVVDGAGRLMYVNPAARRLLGLHGRDVIGRLFEEVSRSPQLHLAVETVLKTGTQHAAEVELSRADRTVTMSAGPLPLEPSPGAVVVLHDVTELRRLEQMRREFVSNVSHELKTPLTSIQAYADALLDGGLDDPAINRGFIERILEQSERLGRLIYDLLNLSRIESQEAVEYETVALEEVIAECLPAHRSVAAARQLTLLTELAPGRLVVQADREGLRTIIDNLLRNALSYTPGGGIVTLRTRTAASRPVLEVQDTGVGISREHQQRVFERFYRVDKARSREVGGTGLGLAIVKHLVEAMGAAIALESEQGRGSTFRITFPQSDIHKQPEVTPPIGFAPDAASSHNLNQDGLAS